MDVVFDDLLERAFPKIGSHHQEAAPCLLPGGEMQLNTCKDDGCVTSRAPTYESAGIVPTSREKRLVDNDSVLVRGTTNLC